MVLVWGSEFKFQYYQIKKEKKKKKNEQWKGISRRRRHIDYEHKIIASIQLHTQAMVTVDILVLKENGFIFLQWECFS
jgi:hypothetical protein